MWELLSFWPALGPLGRALTLALTGLAIGSFLSVLRHRLPLRQDPWQGRSQCPACSQTLGPAELLPVLSYLIQRGRCKHCKAPIPSIYPLLELGTALLAAAGGLVSWTAGLVVLGALIGLTWRRGRSRVRRAAGGYLLVEVVISLFLFALSIGAVLDIFAVARYAIPAGQRRTEAIALARGRFSQIASGVYRLKATQPAKNYCLTQRTLGGATPGDQVLGPGYENYEVLVSFDEGASDDHQCVGLTVTVKWCATCAASRYGQALAPVTVSGYVRK